MSNTEHLFGPLYSCSGAVDIDGDSGSNPAMGRGPCSVVRPITPKRVSGGPKRRVSYNKRRKTNMNSRKIGQGNKHDWEDKQDFISFLKHTLIPDLKESGMDATAEDFETAVYFIEGGK